MVCTALYLAVRDGCGKPLRRLRSCLHPDIGDDFVWVEPAANQPGTADTMTSGSSVSFLGERISRSSAAAAPRADDGPGAGGADREELEQLVANLRLELGRERMRVELLRRDVTNMEEIVDARGVKMGDLESKCRYWREEALRQGEMVDMQTRRVMRLEQEKHRLEQIRHDAELQRVEALRALGEMQRDVHRALEERSL